MRKNTLACMLVLAAISRIQFGATQETKEVITMRRATLSMLRDLIRNTNRADNLADQLQRNELFFMIEPLSRIAEIAAKLPNEIIPLNACRQKLEEPLHHLMLTLPQGSIIKQIILQEAPKLQAQHESIQRYDQNTQDYRTIATKDWAVIQLAAETGFIQQFEDGNIIVQLRGLSQTGPMECGLSAYASASVLRNCNAYNEVRANLTSKPTIDAFKDQLRETLYAINQQSFGMENMANKDYINQNLANGLGLEHFLENRPWGRGLFVGNTAYLFSTAPAPLQATTAYWPWVQNGGLYSLSRPDIGTITLPAVFIIRMGKIAGHYIAARIEQVDGRFGVLFVDSVQQSTSGFENKISTYKDDFKRWLQTLPTFLKKPTTSKQQPPQRQTFNKPFVYQANICGVEVVALEGISILNAPAQAIVNAANEHLGGGSGIDDAFHKAAGPKLRAFNTGQELIDLNKQLLGLVVDPSHRCPVGQARLSKPFDIAIANPAVQWIINVNGPLGPNNQLKAKETPNKDQFLADCYRNAIGIACRHRLDSIAFPTISTGFFGYPIESTTKDKGAAQVAVETVVAELCKLQGTSSLKTVYFALVGKKGRGETQEKLVTQYTKYLQEAVARLSQAQR